MKIDNLEDARRHAKAMASDIAIYNIDRIKKGLETDRLFEELQDDLKEADRNWKSKISKEIREEHNLFQREFVNVIFGSYAQGKFPIF